VFVDEQLLGCGLGVEIRGGVGEEGRGGAAVLAVLDDETGDLRGNPSCAAPIGTPRPLAAGGR
jgi:hypothetical protein